MQKVYVLRGLQASGKSTFSKNLLKSEPNSWKRINRDLLREMLDDSVWSAQNEKLVVKTRDYLITESLRKGYNVIVDDTNLAKTNFDDICKIVEDTNLDCQVVEKNFVVDIEEAIKRDAARTKPVGEEVIRATAKRYSLKYDQHYNCRSQTFSKKIKSVAPPFNPSLANCIMVDLDGTLALIHKRDPYDASKCDEVDEINEPVAQTCELYAKNGFKIVFMSGRKKDFEAATRRFIEKHLSCSYELYMRESHDNRKDSIVKKEMFEANVQNKYNVFFVMDDRNSVVEMWRDLNLKVFQVAPGNF